MKLNILYGVLTQLLIQSPQFKLLNSTSITHDINLNDRDYYRLELPPVDIAVGGLRLKEAHMSIYKKIEPHNPNLGPSHFTAFFADAEGQEYRMHLFLNRFDALGCPPVWEMVNSEEQYVRVDPPEDMDYLTHAIWQLGLPCLQELRQQQKGLESRLRADYNQLEQQTGVLYNNLKINRMAYLESLRQ